MYDLNQKMIKGTNDKLREDFSPFASNRSDYVVSHSHMHSGSDKHRSDNSSITLAFYKPKRTCNHGHIIRIRNSFSFIIFPHD